MKCRQHIQATKRIRMLYLLSMRGNFSSFVLSFAYNMYKLRVIQRLCTNFGFLFYLQPARHTKLEKADILEMTVKHLQSVQRQQLSMAIQTDPTVIHKFKTGFVECAEEVNRYVSQLDNVEPCVRQRLASHLTNCAQNIEHMGTLNSFNTGYRSTTNPSIFGTNSSPLFPGTIPQDINNNGRLQVGGVQLIPQRLPSGELALIMPNSSASTSMFMPPQQPSIDFAGNFSRSSAFSKPSQLKQHTSTTTTTTTSPPLSPVSSISSLGDESVNIHASSEYLSKSPPLDVCDNEESFSAFHRTSNLQQQQVSSTSSEYRRTFDEVFSYKRPLPNDDNSSDSSAEEPSAKKRFVRHDDSGNFTENESGDEDKKDNKSAWRPW
ncbi:hypothetical protein ACFFRR_008514 [Megaselia abdita]